MTRSFFTTLALAVAFAGAPAQAGLDVDLGAHVPLGDDGELFLNISAREFAQPPDVVRSLLPRLPSPDDVSVALFLGQQARIAPARVVEMHASGLPWFEIGIRLGVPVDTWFVPVAVTPGPPYGKAYGHWKKHKRDGTRFVLSDVDARHLVAVRTMHRYFGIPVEEAMARRAKGRDVKSLVATEYRARHGKGAKGGKAVQGGGNEHGGGKAKDHGGGKGKGPGGGHGKGKK